MKERCQRNRSCTSVAIKIFLYVSTPSPSPSKAYHCVNGDGSLTGRMGPSYCPSPLAQCLTLTVTDTVTVVVAECGNRP